MHIVVFNFDLLLVGVMTRWSLQIKLKMNM